GRLVMVSPVSGIYAKVRQKFHLSPLFKFPEPALSSVCIEYSFCSCAVAKGPFVASFARH
ncbi:hypothetical protein, partial [Sinorhizobium medicae]|uniref:hypothetical protein n=1 Tax=Sinorhizobium medicae TaxID=110321 RepID=UPI001AECDFF9